jgi:hypothetical protein
MTSQGGARGNRTLAGIAGLIVRGYRSIADEQRLALRPLTLLGGVNSSGKSSSIQPLLLMKQTLDVSYDPGALLLDGANVKFTNADQLLSRVGGERNWFTIGVEMDNLYTIITKYAHRSSGAGFEIDEMQVRERGATATVTPGMPTDEIRRLIDDRLVQALGERRVELSIERVRCFLQPAIALSDGVSSSAPSDISLSIERTVRRIRDVIHVPALRGNPQRLYPTTATASPFAGTFDNYVASVIFHWQSSKDPRLKQAGRDLATLGLTWKVEARRRDETRVELLVGRLPRARQGGARDLVSIADVGFGVSQCLPVVVALLVAEPNQLLYVEEPEIHLHPMAQLRLADLAIEAAKRGVRVVMETHSSLLLRGVQTSVAKGRIAASDVAMHWFTRSPTTGATVITTAELADDGSFGDWPVDFDDVTLEAERAYLDAV